MEDECFTTLTEHYSTLLHPGFVDKISWIRSMYACDIIMSHDSQTAIPRLRVSTVVAAIKIYGEC